MTSNTSESVNNMFLEARSMPWLEATEKMIDIITSRIALNRRKHIKRPPDDIVPHASQAIKTEWDRSAALEVYELEHGKGTFKVTAPCLEGQEPHCCPRKRVVFLWGVARFSTPMPPFSSCPSEVEGN
jgi:hypothetical protein